MATINKYYTGRKRITIPVSRKVFNSNPIKYIDQYLKACVSTNEENKAEADDLKLKYRGFQDIWNKKRLNGDNENNNMVEVNHLFRQVEFKKGFMVGNPISYSLGVSDKNTDDLTYLNKYFKDSKKGSLDIDKYEDLYVCGIAEQFVIPKTYDYDIENEAPFELYNIEVGVGFKVYSNDITKQPLFDVVVSEVVNEEFKVKKQYEIYFINALDGFTYHIVYDSSKKRIENNEAVKQPYKFLPIVEFELNKNRMGIVELVMSIQEALNIIQSNQIDDIVDFVNAYLVFENQSVGKDYENKMKMFKQTRTISIKSTNPQLPAKVTLLKQTLQHTEINASFELLLKEMYDIVACPQTSGGVTSGGDTGEARILGNGWESAQNQAKVDIGYGIQFEYELLKNILTICRTSPNTPIKEIYASDIDIKYSINMSNNILTKTQALQNLYSMHVPYEEALGIVGLTSDTHGLAEKWAKFDKEAKTIATQMQTKNLGNKSDENKDNSNSDTNSDSNSDSDN